MPPPSEQPRPPIRTTLTHAVAEVTAGAARSHTARLVTLACMVLAGVVGLAISIKGISDTLFPTASARAESVRQAKAERWHTWPAARIFPETLRYQGRNKTTLQANRLGIARRTGCANAVDPRVATVLRGSGCVAVLRGTYVDATGTYLVTVGIAVLRDAAAGQAAYTRITGLSSGTTRGRPPTVRPAPFPATLSRGFAPGQRFTATTVYAGSGRYVTLATGGYVDGRAFVPVEEGVYDAYLNRMTAKIAWNIQNDINAASRRQHG